MYIIYELQEPIECPHCSGLGEIRIDLFNYVELNRDMYRVIMCGHCEGYGYIEPEIEFDPDFSFRPDGPDAS